MKKWVASLSILLLLAGCATEDITNEQTERQQLLVELAPVQISSIGETLELSGQLLPTKQVPLVTAMPLKVTDVHTQIGQAVEAGDLLISLDDGEARRQVNQANQVLDELKQALHQAEQINQSVEQNISAAADLETELLASIERAQELLQALDEAGGAADQQALTDLLQASLDVSLKQAALTQAAGAGSLSAPLNTAELSMQINQAEEAVRQAESALAETRITAPIAGTIAQLDVTAGQTAIPNQPLAIVSDLSKMDAAFAVNSFQVARLAAGMPLSLSIAGWNETIETELTAVSPVIDPQTNAFMAHATVPNESQQLKGGMRVTATVELGTVQEAVVIPADAVLYQDGEPYTFVAEENRVRRQELELGTRDGASIQVIDGVNEGDEVVTVGKERLTDGAAITVRSE